MSYDSEVINAESIYHAAVISDTEFKLID